MVANEIIACVKVTCFFAIRHENDHSRKIAVRITGNTAIFGYITIKTTAGIKITVRDLLRQLEAFEKQLRFHIFLHDVPSLMFH